MKSESATAKTTAPDDPFPSPVEYHCPYSGKLCPIKKSCHVLTTAGPLVQRIMVLQKCPAAGKTPDGKTAEIPILIGFAA